MGRLRHSSTHLDPTSTITFSFTDRLAINELAAPPTHQDEPERFVHVLLRHANPCEEWECELQAV